jgi:hypothetical protein
MIDTKQRQALADSNTAQIMDDYVTDQDWEVWIAANDDRVLKRMFLEFDGACGEW